MELCLLHESADWGAHVARLFLWRAAAIGRGAKKVLHASAGRRDAARADKVRSPDSL
jgi:hypothetical protein